MARNKGRKPMLVAALNSTPPAQMRRQLRAPPLTSQHNSVVKKTRQPVPALRASAAGCRRTGSCAEQRGDGSLVRSNRIEFAHGEGPQRLVPKIKKLGCTGSAPVCSAHPDASFCAEFQFIRKLVADRRPTPNFVMYIPRALTVQKFVQRISPRGFPFVLHRDRSNAG